MVAKVVFWLCAGAAGVGLILGYLALQPGLLGDWGPWVFMFAVVLIVLAVLGVLWELLLPVWRKITGRSANGVATIQVLGGTNTFNVGTPARTSQPLIDDQNWLADDVLASRSFRLVDVPRVGQVIKGKRYTNCTIHGPAVVAFMGTGEFSSNNLQGGSKELILWEVPDPWLANVGVIVMHDCRVTDCTLINIGIAGASAVLHKFDPPDGTPLATRKRKK